MTNPSLKTFLQLCLIFDFDLLSTNASPQKPRMANVHIGLEPSDISHVFNIMMGQDPPSNPQEVEGMLQINGIHSDIHGSITPSPNRMEIWRTQREQLTSAGFPNAHIIILEIMKGNDNQVIAVTLPIDHVVLKTAATPEPFEYRSALTGKTTYAPMNAQTCLEYINKDIRADRHNRYKLRAPMAAADFAIIQEACRAAEGDQLSPAGGAFRYKLDHESTYEKLIIVK
ncbi:hypothetical protein C8Q75DRAFT_180156 [Abortiporus biennis]|nr:hypothetical protein C8Q75DRAFT_180156 [Abortiporus biennis]